MEIKLYKEDCAGVCFSACSAKFWVFGSVWRLRIWLGAEERSHRLECPTQVITEPPNRPVERRGILALIPAAPPPQLNPASYN